MLTIWEAQSHRDRYRSLAARHAIFCEGGGGQVLEYCQASSPCSSHDEYDQHALLFGVSQDGVVIATARLVLARPLPMGQLITDLPTGRIWDRLHHAPALDNSKRYSEPSRVGVLAAHQRTPVGRRALLALIGLLVNRSVAAGCHDYLLTVRAVMFRAFNWLPWDIGNAFLYPSEEGGPITHEPIWPATLNLHEFVVATEQLNPGEFPLMFPDLPPWLDRSQVRSRQKLSALAQYNRQAVADRMRSWNQGDRVLPVLAPRSKA